MIDIERLKEIAKKRNMNLQAVSLKAGLGKNTIYHWKEQNPTIENLTKVADALHVSVDYLLGHTNDPAESSEPSEIDLSKEMHSDYTLMSWKGKPIPPEELEMIRRILDGGKN